MPVNSLTATSEKNITTNYALINIKFGSDAEQPAVLKRFPDKYVLPAIDRNKVTGVAIENY